MTSYINLKRDGKWTRNINIKLFCLKSFIEICTLKKEMFSVEWRMRMCVCAYVHVQSQFLSHSYLYAKFSFILRSSLLYFFSCIHFYDFGFLLSFRLTLTLSCAMNFASYPHDTQTCSLQMESCKFPEL